MAHIVKEHADEAMDELLCIKDVNGIAKKSKGAAIFFAVSFFLAFTFFIVPVHTWLNVFSTFFFSFSGIQWNKGILDEYKEEQKALVEHDLRVSSMGGGLKKTKTAIAL